MKRSLRQVIALATVTLAVAAGSTSAQAQYRRYGYPGGYGGYGWGGWGGGGTVQGDYARGLGNLAAGAGQYNEQTAEARSINADTAMKWNEYIYESQMVTNQKYWEKMDREKKNTIATRQKINDQLRNNPSREDIESGEAMNVALDDVNNPKVYLRGLDSAKAKLDGETIRNIPFQYASAAIVTSIHDLTHNGPPELLKKSDFDDDRTALRDVAAKIRAKTDDGKQPTTADIQQAQTVIKSIRKTLETNYDRQTPGFSDAEKFLKSAYALTRMLQGPAINVILSGVEKRKDATLTDLLGFMNSFNLRFGPATTLEQRQAYNEIFPLLDQARDEATAGLGNNPRPATASNAHPHDFFGGMNYQDLEANKSIPQPPAPNNN